MSALPSRPLRRIVLTTVGTAAGGLLLLSLKPHTAASALSSVDAGSAPSPGPTSTGPTSTGTAGTTGGGSSSSGTRTVDGDAIQTRYGPVQVRITLNGGRITAVTAVQLPQDNRRDVEISGFAVPQLTQEALSAQSARIDTVSGATYTSEGYVQSLQSALDKAGS